MANKMTEKDDGAIIDGFVNLSLVDSYKGHIVIMDHIRGTGKSYSVFNRAIKRFVNKDEGFIVIRRTKGEIDSLKQYPWPDGLESAWEKKGVKLTNVGKSLKINGKLAGTLIYLSGNGAKNAKSSALPFKVTTAIFDEFQIESEFGGRYLKNEPSRLNSVISSYVRYADFKLFMCGNSDSYYNDYYLQWDVWPKLDGGIRYYPDKGIVLWHAIAAPKAKSIGLNELFDNATSGKYKDLDNSSIWKSRKDDEPIARIEIDDKQYGVYITINSSFVLREKGEGPLFSMKPHDSIPNITKSPWFESYQLARQLGKRYFESVKLKRYFESNQPYL